MLQKAEKAFEKSYRATIDLGTREQIKIIGKYHFLKQSVLFLEIYREKWYRSHTLEVWLSLETCLGPIAFEWLLPFCGLCSVTS